MIEINLFKKALDTLCFTWGSDAPAEAVWAFNDLMLWLEKEYNVKMDDYLEEDLSNHETVIKNIENLLEKK
jgi:hypothetical protein